MHPTGRPLDAEFQPAASSAAPPPNGPPSDGTEMIIQDFNAFFEKLSGLDDVRWSDEPQPAPRAAVPSPMAEPARTAQPSRGTPTAGSPMPRPAPPAAPKTPSGAPTPGARAAAPSPATKLAAKAGVPLGFKLAMTALLLFAIGMGAGWMALSLPHATDSARLTENPLLPVDPKPAEATGAAPADPAAGARRADPVPAAASAPAGATEVAATEHGAPRAADPDGDGDEPDAFSQSGSEPAAAAVETKVTATPTPKSAAQATAKAAPKATSPAGAPAAPPVAAASATSGRYAVQVGACSSARCVDTYRALIQPHVGTHPVHVVEQATAAATVQRVRVEPLTREQALALKQALEQADPRLKHAYIVRTAERS